jgi:hypothetical protein
VTGRTERRSGWPTTRRSGRRALPVALYSVSCGAPYLEAVGYRYCAILTIWVARQRHSPLTAHPLQPNRKGPLRLEPPQQHNIPAGLSFGVTAVNAPVVVALPTAALFLLKRRSTRKAVWVNTIFVPVCHFAPPSALCRYGWRSRPIGNRGLAKKGRKAPGPPCDGADPTQDTVFLAECQPGVIQPIPGCAPRVGACAAPGARLGGRHAHESFGPRSPTNQSRGGRSKRFLKQHGWNRGFGQYATTALSAVT